MDGADLDLASVRAELEQLAGARLLGELSERDRARYAFLAGLERQMIGLHEEKWAS